MARITPFRYESETHTYFNCTLKDGVEVASFRETLDNGKPDNLPLSLLGSVGPGDMASEIVVALEGVPSSVAKQSEEVAKAHSWLQERDQLDGEVTIMEFKQRSKR